MVISLQQPEATLTIDDIIAGGIDHTGLVARFDEVLKAHEAEYGQGLIANQIINETISIDPYGWQRQVNINSIDESLGYNVETLAKIMNTANSADRAHYVGILAMLKKAMNEK